LRVKNGAGCDKQNATQDDSSEVHAHMMPRACVRCAEKKKAGAVQSPGLEVEMKTDYRVIVRP
jgi:hypothetical protein